MKRREGKTRVTPSTCIAFESLVKKLELNQETSFYYKSFCFKLPQCYIITCNTFSAAPSTINENVRNEKCVVLFDQGAKASADTDTVHRQCKRLLRYQ
jgi:hypothetical protein